MFNLDVSFILNQFKVNGYQNGGENCVFLQCQPFKRYLYLGISRDIISSGAPIYYYIDVLKNSAKVTGMHLHRSLYLTCNFQLHWFFRNTFTMENLPRTSVKRRIFWKTENRHYYNEDMSWSWQLFQKYTLRGKVFIWEILIEGWHWA